MDILLGQFDKYFQVFIILMIIDYLSGIIATIYKKEINLFGNVMMNLFEAITKFLILALFK